MKECSQRQKIVSDGVAVASQRGAAQHIMKTG